MNKMKSILKSRKFWVLIATLVGIGQSFVSGKIDDWQAIQMLVAASAAYSLGTGIESGLQGSK